MWGRVSDLPVRGVSHSVRGQRPPQLADLEVYPTLPTKMRTAGQALPPGSWMLGKNASELPHKCGNSDAM